MGQNPSGLGKDPAPLNLKPRILELGNLGLGKILQGAGLAGLACRAPPHRGGGGWATASSADLIILVCMFGVLDCGFVVLCFVSFGGYLARRLEKTYFWVVILVSK